MRGVTLVHVMLRTTLGSQLAAGLSVCDVVVRIYVVNVIDLSFGIVHSVRFSVIKSRMF